MSAPKHTPGPWLLDLADSSYAIHWREYIIAAKGHEARPLNPSEIADAKLMAAAPRLAAALLKLANRHEAACHPADHAPGCEGCEAWAALKAAGVL